MKYLPCSCDAGSFQGGPCLNCGAQPIDDHAGVGVAVAGICLGAVLVIISVVILHWLLPEKLRCQDIHSSPQLRGTVYDKAMGQCEETR